MPSPDRPHPNCYWVQPGRLLAGEYPGALREADARQKLARLLEAGVTFFVDLTAPHELHPYAALLEAEAQARGCTVVHRRLPITDGDIPQTPQAMATILDTIDQALATGHTVYVHCWGGVGRTGTVVGCHMVRHGQPGAAALHALAQWWQTVEKRQRHPHSPETEAQRAYILYWAEQDRSHMWEEARFDRFQGCLLGLAVGDAVGTTLEFQPPGSFAPIADMMGGGPFQLQPGQWTDDTSMALCLAASLVERQAFDPRDQMARYVRWWQQGYLSSTGRCFDIGNTVAAALRRFLKTGEPLAGATAPDTAGNGSIMRLAPVPMFFCNHPEAAMAYAGQSSRTTHGASAAVDACRYLGGLLVGAINGARKDALLAPLYSPVAGYWDRHPLHPDIAAIAAGSYRHKNPPAIRGTGYVVASLEAALWAFAQTENFRDGCLCAVNLGEDADTTGAVYGQLAGACYGTSGIPAAWLACLAECALIAQLIAQLSLLATAPDALRHA